jgi:hypothetical protein
LKFQKVDSKFTALSKSWAKTSWFPSGEEKWSATSSNFTFVGHKEDTLVKKISERLAARLRRNVVVTAGVHWDGITSKEIKIIQNLTQKISDQILKKILSAGRQGRRQNEDPKKRA